MAIDPSKVKRYTTNFNIPIYEYTRTLWNECIESAFDIIDTSVQAVKTYAEGLYASVVAQVGIASGHATTATTQAGIATTQAGISTTQAGIATVQAELAAQLVGAISGTSITSNTVGVGNKTFTTQAGEQYIAGVFMMASSQSIPASFMFGQVVSYTGDQLVIDVQVIGVAGTLDDWNLSLAGVRGAVGPPGPTMLETIAFDDRASLRTTVGVGAGSCFFVENIGLFAWVPASTELDDDETCFQSTGGAWELQSTNPDYVYAQILQMQQEMEDKLLYGEFVMTLTTLAAATTTNFTCAVLGAGTSDSVVVTPRDAFGTADTDRRKLSYAAYVSAVDTVTINIRNNDITNAAAMSAGMWSVLVIKR